MVSASTASGIVISVAEVDATSLDVPGAAFLFTTQCAVLLDVRRQDDRQSLPFHTVGFLRREFLAYRTTTGAERRQEDAPCGGHD